MHLRVAIILVLLALVVGVPFVLRPTPAEDEAAGATQRLIIISPHNEQIRYEFARAFNRHRRAQGKPPVEIDWRVTGGTSDQRRMVLSRLEAAASAGREDAGLGADLFFGGGEFEHNQLKRGVTVQRDGREVQVAATEPIDLPDELLQAAFPEPHIGSEPLYDPDLHWVGAALASFGIVYNRDVLRMLGLDEPETWADLADPAYRGWVALADPSHSGSIAATYNVIIRRMGWDEGWRMMREIFANARYFTSSAAKVPVDVSQGEAAAGMCIDFYGRFQAGAVGDDRVGYVDPPGMTATTADPIAILRGAPNRELANAFIRWLLSEQAQNLWQRRVGVDGGPERFELRRQPIRRSVYRSKDREQWADPDIDPFVVAEPMPEGVPDYYPIIAPLAHAMGIDIHAELTRAWAALQRGGGDRPHAATLHRLFYRMPGELTIDWPDDELAGQWHEAIADPSHARHNEAAAVLAEFADDLAQRYFGSGNRDRLLEARIRWTRFFRQNYREIDRLADD